MEISESDNVRSPWLSLVISMNYLEIIAFGALGVLTLGSVYSILLLGLAGIQIYLTKELSRFTATGKDGSIILYLIMGFGLGNIVSLLFALQLYGIAFNEPTINLFKRNALVNESEEMKKVSI